MGPMPTYLPPRTLENLDCPPLLSVSQSFLGEFNRRHVLYSASAFRHPATGPFSSSENWRTPLTREALRSPFQFGQNGVQWDVLHIHERVL